MSGISTTGDVKLDGDPNAFTGTNTFDVNRPTSSLGGTPNTTDYITKQDGDTLYQGTGNVALLNGNNGFTGTTNTFDNRPAASSTPATLAGTLDFVIKRDTDLLYVTKATDQDITGKKTLEDTLTLDGASNINIGQIDLKGSVGNTIHQFTGSFGNQILQWTNTASAPSMPLGASLIYQAGTNDIIETEGKVVCPTAPTSGNDLTNKTYVDTEIAAAGGGGGPFAFTRTEVVDDITMASETNTPLTDLVVNITPTSTDQKVILHLTLLGDFDGDSWEPTIRIKRTIGGVDTYLTPTTAGSRNPMNSTFSVAVGLNDYSGTIKQANMVLVDTNPTTTSQITYTPVLFGFSANTFYQNRTKNDTNNVQHERSFSTFTAECKA